MSLSTHQLFDLLNSNSRAVAYRLVEPLSRLLSIAGELCDGDLEQFVLMVAVSLRSSQHPEFQNLKDADLHGRMVLPGFGTNMRSLAESTGIPRETVRRKVALLIARGWVVADEGTLYYTIDGYRSVEPARDAIIRMYVRGFEVLGSIQRTVTIS